MQAADVQHCVKLVRDNAPDLYLADLLLKDPARTAAQILHAFHIELTNIVLGASEPMVGQVGLQWWADVISGLRVDEAMGHPTARALLALIEDKDLSATSLDAKIEAHIFDLYNDPMADRTMLEGYCGETRSIVFNMVGLCAGAEPDETLSNACGHAGVATGLTGILQNLPRHHENRQVYFPADLLQAAGLDAEAFLQTPQSMHENAVAAMLDLAQEHLEKANLEITKLPADLRSVFKQLALTPLYLDGLRDAPQSAFQKRKTPSQLRRQWALWRY